MSSYGEYLKESNKKESFGTYLKKIREEKGLTRKDIWSAKYIPESSLEKYENNRCKTIPSNVILALMDKYQDPSLPFVSCRRNCAIGSYYSLDLDIGNLENPAVAALQYFDEIENIYNEQKKVKEAIISAIKNQKLNKDNNKILRELARKNVRLKNHAETMLIITASMGIDIHEIVKEENELIRACV